MFEYFQLTTDLDLRIVKLGVELLSMQKVNLQAYVVKLSCPYCSQKSWKFNIKKVGNLIFFLFPYYIATSQAS